MQPHPPNGAHLCGLERRGWIRRNAWAVLGNEVSVFIRLEIGACERFLKRQKILNHSELTAFDPGFFLALPEST
jgi:hypothetical protein